MNFLFEVVDEPAQDRVSVEALTVRELQVLLHWYAMDDRALLLTACRNRKIEFVDRGELA